MASTKIVAYLDRVQFVNGDAVAVPAGGLTAIATIDVSGARKLCLHFDVTAQDLDEFIVLGKSHENGQLVDFTPQAPVPDWTGIPSGSRFSTAARSTTSSGAVVDGNLALVSTLQNGYFEMDVDGLNQIVVKASAAVDSAVVTPRWSLS